MTKTYCDICMKFKTNSRRDVNLPHLSSSWLIAKRSPGFTLIELVVVIGIISILALIAYLGYKGYVYKAEIVSAVNEINILEKEIRGYEIEFADLPDSLNDIDQGGFLDPWQQPYVYLKHSIAANALDLRRLGGSLINDEFDLFSSGKDNLTNFDIQHADSLDDIIRAKNGGFRGMAKRYTP